MVKGITKKELLLSLRKESGNSINFRNDVMWKAAKFNISILSALFSIWLGILYFGIQQNLHTTNMIIFSLSLLPMPVIMCVLAYFGIKNFRREYGGCQL